MQIAPIQQLDRVFGALSDPTRRAILARLARGDATVNELVAPFDLAQPTISKHLKVLEHAGLVSRGRDAQFRPVRLNAGPLRGAAQWIGDYQRFWEESLDRLGDYAKKLHRKETRRAQERKRR
jgi:DNA-binding transcriptional ArsR family regulator